MIQNPSVGPYVNFKHSATWVIITPMKLHHQTTGNRGGGFAITNREEEIKLMAPTNLQENINHQWTEYQTMASRILAKAAGFDNLEANLAALGNVGKNWKQVLDSAMNAKKVGGSIRSAINAAGNKANNVKIPHNKIDNPLVYETSPHRSISISFSLATQSKKRPLGKDIYDITFKLIEYSSPDLKQNDIEIELPYIFSVKTSPAGIINYPVCALTSVQPDYKAPYSDGYPLTIDLTLTFEDLRPIFRTFLKDEYKPRVLVKHS